jgi:hypothetical protein
MSSHLSCHEFETRAGSVDAGGALPVELAEHLTVCPRCREFSGSDPSRLFALLRGRSPEPAPDWESFWERAQQKRRQDLAARRPRRGWVAAAACGIILGAVVWLLRPAGGRPPSVSVDAGSPAALSGAGPGAGGELPAVVPAVSAPPTLESIASPDARVVDFKIFGGEDQVTEVILIFDKGIEL